MSVFKLTKHTIHPVFGVFQLILSTVLPQIPIGSSKTGKTKIQNNKKNAPKLDLKKGNVVVSKLIRLRFSTSGIQQISYKYQRTNYAYFI